MTNATKTKQRADHPNKAQRHQAELRSKRQRTLVFAIIGLVAVVVIAAILLTGGGSSDTPPSAVGQVTIAPTSGPVKAGDSIPAFSAPALGGGTMTLVGVRGRAGPCWRSGRRGAPTARSSFRACPRPPPLINRRGRRGPGEPGPPAQERGRVLSRGSRCQSLVNGA